MKKIEYIAWYQIFGGIGGIAVMIFSLALNIEHFGEILPLLLIAFGLFSFSIYSGKMLLEKETAEKGIKRSMINQILQVFTISLFGLTYQFYAGFQLSLGVNLTYGPNFMFDMSLFGSSFTYSGSSNQTLVMINIVPLIIIYFLNSIELNPYDENLIDEFGNDVDNYGG